MIQLSTSKQGDSGNLAAALTGIANPYVAGGMVAAEGVTKAIDTMGRRNHARITHEVSGEGEISDNKAYFKQDLSDEEGDSRDKSGESDHE